MSTETTLLNLFPTPVIVHDLSNAETVNKAVKSVIMQKKQKTAGVNLSNRGGWHSETDMNVWAPDFCNILLPKAMELVIANTAQTQSGKSNFQFTTTIWANVNTAGDSNVPHAHPHAIWSGVYYVDDGLEDPVKDISGELILMDPRHPMTTMYMPRLTLKDEKGRPQMGKVIIKPQSGRLVIFPSWLLHYVNVYHGKRERISVAFNVSASLTTG